VTAEQLLCELFKLDPRIRFKVIGGRQCAALFIESSTRVTEWVCVPADAA
jgi:hypothetical protein